MHGKMLISDVTGENGKKAVRKTLEEDQ